MSPDGAWVGRQGHPHVGPGHANMAGMATADALRLVIGDEELLVTRGVAAALTAARETSPDAGAQEHAAADMTAGDFMYAVSPSPATTSTPCSIR